VYVHATQAGRDAVGLSDYGVVINAVG